MRRSDRPSSTPKPQIISLDSQLLRSPTAFSCKSMPVHGFTVLSESEMGDQINHVPRGADREPLLDERPEMEVAFFFSSSGALIRAV